MPTSKTLVQRIADLTVGQFILVLVAGVAATYWCWRSARAYEAGAAFAAMANSYSTFTGDSGFKALASAIPPAPKYAVTLYQVGAVLCGVGTVLITFTWLGRSKYKRVIA